MTVLIDVRFHRIPNVVLILLLLIQILSLLFQTITEGFSIDLETAIPHFLTVILIFLILFFFFSIGTMGAGDVKLIALTAFWVKDPLIYFLLIFVIGAVLAIGLMLVNGSLYRRVRMLLNYLSLTFSLGKAIPYYETQVAPSEKKKYSVHLSIPIFIAFTAVSIIQNL